MFYDSDEIYHVGVKRRSGRYPWGSGEKWGKKKNDPGSGQRAKESKKNDKKKEPLSKEQILASRSVHKVAKNTKKFSDEELRQLANRFQSEYTIKDLSKKQNSMARGKNWLSTTADTSEKIAKIIKSSTSIIKDAATLVDMISKKKKN